ncbi:MAG TPA: peptidylprolyl isomerase [Dongiaceae bacterium]
MRFDRLLVLGMLCVCIGGLTSVLSLRPAQAQDELKIAAVINDDVITQLDVYMRLRMAMLSAKLQDTPETRQRLLPTVMRTLIDDHLKTQEAKARGIDISQREIDARIGVIAQRNNMSRSDFDNLLASNGILVTALGDQIRSDISWSLLVQRKLRPTIRITDEEINESLDRAKEARGQQEYHLSQIFLAVDSPKDVTQVQQSAQRLLEQLQGGAEFGSLATEFSQDTGADGGDLGWVRADEIDQAVAREVVVAAKGADAKGKLLGPIQGTGGFYLVRIEDTRQAGVATVTPGTVHMAQLLWALAANAADSEVAAAGNQAKAMAGKSQSCQDFQRQAADAAPAQFRDLGTVSINDLPPEIKTYAINQPVGTSTPPIRGSGGVAVFVVCDRGDASGELSRVAIADRLAQERLETLARGYLSDLRRAAIIDIRL